MLRRICKTCNLQLAIILLACTVCRGLYYQSHAQCGYQGSGEFIRFDQAEYLQTAEQSVGVCDWGITNYTNVGVDSNAGKCLQCSFTPVSLNPTCPDGYTLDKSKAWHLAQSSMCESQGCLDIPCPDNTIEAGSVACGIDGAISRTCCQLRYFYRCCTALPCTQRTTPSGKCLAQDRDLLPGQAVATPVYAFPRASTLCSPYSFMEMRKCQPDSTFLPGHFYESCKTAELALDNHGCPQLPGYTLMPNKVMVDPAQANWDDMTPWDQLPPSSKQLAAADMVLMAGRCDQSSICTAFDTTGSVVLRYYLPLSAGWTEVQGTCQGTYVKTSPPRTCPRIKGYLFHPRVTLGPSLHNTSMCSQCGESQALAHQCSKDPSCTGFSNMHGLTTATLLPSSLQYEFTSTPCMGTYQRTSTAHPAEVEELDKLLCGDSQYCTHRLHYYSRVTSSPAGSYQVHITVALINPFEMPQRLISPDTATAGAMSALPHITSLEFKCADQGKIIGGLPIFLLRVLTGLHRLVISGCAVQDQLPPDWALLAPKSLQVIDLSANQLSGVLPRSWGSSMQLGYLNLSHNALTGQVPDQWHDILISAPDMALEGVEDAQLMVLDMSSNRLSAPLPRTYVSKACLSHQLQLGFTRSTQADYSLQDGHVQLGSRPAVLLYGNQELSQWAGSYQYAVGRRSYATRENEENMCGSYWYIVTLSVMWGCFGLCLVALLAWGRHHRKRQAQHLKRTSSNSTPLADPNAGLQPTPLLDRLWSKPWFRRLVFVVRLVYLLADMMLDIAVAVWLFNDGSRKEAVACTVFMLLAQGVVSLAIYVAIMARMFSSMCSLLLLSPVLLAVTPVLAPALALWNVVQPEVPLVLWRYLELVEFAVMLLQAPALSITQTIIYVKQNKMGNGMYLNHGLFVASIILSLGDILISIYKLLRYKHGAWRRIINALSHLDQSSDPHQYISDLDYFQGGLTSHPDRPQRGQSYLLPTGSIDNPLLPVLAQLQQQLAGGGVGGSKGSHSSGNQYTANPASEDLVQDLRHASFSSQVSEALSIRSTSSGKGSFSKGTTRYRPPSLLQQSSQRLSRNDSGDVVVPVAAASVSPARPVQQQLATSRGPAPGAIAASTSRQGQTGVGPGPLKPIKVGESRAPTGAAGVTAATAAAGPVTGVHTGSTSTSTATSGSSSPLSAAAATGGATPRTTRLSLSSASGFMPTSSQAAMPGPSALSPHRGSIPVSLSGTSPHAPQWSETGSHKVTPRPHRGTGVVGSQQELQVSLPSPINSPRIALSPIPAESPSRFSAMTRTDSVNSVSLAPTGQPPKFAG